MDFALKHYDVGKVADSYATSMLTSSLDLPSPSAKAQLACIAAQSTVLWHCNTSAVPERLVATTPAPHTTYACAGYDIHVVHVQPVHKNMMNHADEDYREAGVTSTDTKQHEGKATDLVLA